jgi:hypothetical protein
MDKKLDKAPFGFDKYVQSVGTPIYEPKNKKPSILELYNSQKTNDIVNRISRSTLPDEEKEFLISAAQRHTVFNYQKIADYYSHSPKEMQELMEDSALVIIDFKKAIELGYVKLSSAIRQQYLKEYGE